MSAPARTRGHRLAAAAAAVTALLLTGCGGPTSSWTFQGKPVEDAEETLTAITERWRSLMAGEDVEVNIPETAQCYLQVADDELVGEEVLCGPLAFMGAEETQWVLAELSANQTADKGVRLRLDDETRFDFGTANPNSVPLDASGEPADLAQQVEPPTAPPAEVDAVIPLQQSDLESAGEPYELVTPDATYTIRSAGVLSQVGDPTAPTGAPEGGSLVTVGVERSAHSNAPTSPTSKAVLTAGGSEHEIPDEPSAIAVQGDGADAVISVEYDGNTQQYNLASGELTGGRPFTVTELAAVNSPRDELIGDETKGESTAYSFRVLAGTSSWDEEGGWAPEGKDRAHIDLSVESRSAFHESYHRVKYEEKAYSITALTVTADGQEIPVDPASVTLAPRADDDYENLAMLARLVLEVPEGTQEITVSATVEVAATPRKDESTSYSRETTDGEPESISATLELPEVTLTAKE